MLTEKLLMNNDITIRTSTSTDSSWLTQLMEKNWGGLPLVIRGKKYDPNNLDGIIVENQQSIAGFLFYEIKNDNCEIIVFEVFDRFKGTGTIMLENLKSIAKNNGCTRIYLMTTNDNLEALRFYQRRGFTIGKIHIDSVKHSRKIKPTIGLIGDYGIPVRDEIDLELFL